MSGFRGLIYIRIALAGMQGALATRREPASAECKTTLPPADARFVVRVECHQSSLKSVKLHKLKGDRKGQWAMTVRYVIRGLHPKKWR